MIQQYERDWAKTTSKGEFQGKSHRWPKRTQRLISHLPKIPWLSPCNMGFGFCFLFKISGLLFIYFFCLVSCSCYVFLLSVCHVVIGCISHVNCFLLVGLSYDPYCLIINSPHLAFVLLLSIEPCNLLFVSCVSVYAKSVSGQVCSCHAMASQVCFKSSLRLFGFWISLCPIKAAHGFLQLSFSGLIVTPNIL